MIKPKEGGIRSYDVITKSTGITCRRAIVLVMAKGNKKKNKIPSII